MRKSPKQENNSSIGHVTMDTKKLLEDLASESRLSLLQYRGLFEHLNAKGVPKKPEKVAIKAKKKYSLDEIASLRKKDAIIQSGVYERDKIVPPKGKLVNDLEKERLIYYLAFGCERPPTPSLEEVLQKRDLKHVAEVESINSLKARWKNELLQGIEDRLDFLDKMNSLKINTMHTNVVKMEVSKMMKEMKLVDSAEKKITTNKKD